MKAIYIKSKAFYAIVLFLLIGTFVSFRTKNVAAQQQLFILSDRLFSSLGPRQISQLPTIQN